MVWNDLNYKTVSGVFTSQEQVEELLSTLQQHGIGTDLVDVMMSDQTRDQYTHLSKENKLPEGASVGGLSGGILGVLLGGLTMSGMLLIPGMNLLVAGPIIGAIAGGAVGTATGSLAGALVGAGIPEIEAKAYEAELKQPGNVLVVAHVIIDEVQAVEHLFNQHGARNVVIKADAPMSIA